MLKSHSKGGNVKMKCNYCAHFIDETTVCEYCKFEYHEIYTDDNWDIFSLDDEIEWSNFQIQYRLKQQGIECLYADIWYDNNIAFIIGAKANAARVARALRIHVESIYDDFEHGFMILNLLEEKLLRKGLSIEELVGD